MSLLNWLSAILPKFKKSEVEEDLKATMEELRDAFGPGYKAASSLFSATKFKSNEVDRIAHIFHSDYKRPKGISQTKNFISDIEATVSNISENISFLYDCVDSKIEELILKDGLTLYKTKLLRSCEQASWLVRFGDNLLDFVYGCEAKANGGDVELFDFSPRTTKTIYEEVSTFAKLIAFYGQKPEDFKKAIGNVPDIIYNASTANSIAAVIGEADTEDNAGYYSQGFTYSPIYRIGMLWAEWQGHRYRKMKLRKQMFEFRVLYLQSLLEGTQDPKLENEMQVLQKWIEELDYKMKKLED